MTSIDPNKKYRITVPPAFAPDLKGSQVKTVLTSGGDPIIGAVNPDRVMMTGPAIGGGGLFFSLDELEEINDE